MPSTRSMTQEGFDTQMAGHSLVHFTDHFSMDSEVPSTDGSTSTVSYRLVGRVLFSYSGGEHPNSSNHFTSHLLIGNRTFFYDDLNGVLEELGDTSFIETLSRKDSLWIYHRTTANMWIERMVLPILNSSSTNQPIIIKSPQYIEIHDDLAPSSAKAIKLPISSQDSVLKDEIETFFDALATRNSEPPVKTQTHIRSISWASSNKSDFPLHFTSLWTDSMIGTFGFFPSNDRSKHSYAARVGNHAGGSPVLEWYYGNTFLRGERPRSGTYHLSFEAIGKILNDQADYGGIILQPGSIGPFQWPTRLVSIEEGSNPHWKYTNQVIETALLEAFNCIVDLLCSPTTINPIMVAFKYHWKSLKGGDKVKRTSEWLQDFHLPILPGDGNLVDRMIDKLFTKLKQSDSICPTWVNIDSLVFGPGKLLFLLVVMRVYLERSPQDDDEIARLIVGIPEAKVKPHSSVYKRHYCLLRRTTIPEYVLAATDGDQLPEASQADCLDILKLDASPRHLSQINATISNDIDIQWFDEQPILFIALSNSKNIDEVQYVWGQPTSQGLTTLIPKGRRVISVTNPVIQDMSAVIPDREKLKNLPRPKILARKPFPSVVESKLKRTRVEGTQDDAEMLSGPDVKRLRRSLRNHKK
ncbi:hypothetical protein QCA50_020900 [Cerrena zonata]|uniref:Uncharacterized protein n=1 Tax=Cerrena zonata TaxID=2478898 RepID=A0AAW0FDK1_9APHY